MNRFPIVERELRVASRRSSTWWFRISATLLGLGFLGIMLLVGELNPPQGGRNGLRGLGIIMLGLAALSGCFLTADSISAERREGTLGLLFLTPLRSRDVVLGKLVVSGLTMTLALVALLPLLFITMLVGGVTVGLAVHLAVAILTTQLLSLGLGLLVSVLNVDSTRAAITTLVIMTLVLLLPVLVFEVWRDLANRPLSFNPLVAVSPVYSLIFTFEARWAGAGSQHFWWCIATQLTIGTTLLVLAWRILARNWRRSLEPAPVPRPATSPGKTAHPKDAFQFGNPYQQLVSRQVQDPAWARWFRRFVWLVLGIMCACLLLLANPDLDIFLTGSLLAALSLHLLVGFALVLEASRLTHQHLHSGAYEQLLATPLPPLLIVIGLKDAIARRFRRAMWAVAATNALVGIPILIRQNDLYMGTDGLVLVAAFLLGGLLTSTVNFSVLQWAGINRGLRERTPLRAATKALLIVHVPPWLMFFAVFIVAANNVRGEMIVALVFFAYYLAATAYAILLGLGLRRKVKRQFRELVAAGL